jgi:hypothetical protein
MRLMIFFLISILGIKIPLMQINFQLETPPPQPDLLSFTTPNPGQAVQGIVPISGIVNPKGFRKGELSYTYKDDPRETWFLITELTEPVSNGLIAEWDTTIITDGEYTLRLLVNTSGQQQMEVFLKGIRVRNYTPIETNTPAPSASPAPLDTVAPSPTSTPTATQIPSTLTPFPPNPVELTTQEINNSLIRGAVIGIGLLAIFGLYILLKNLKNRE